jgi:hypothetical protein
LCDNGHRFLVDTRAQSAARNAFFIPNDGCLQQRHGIEPTAIDWRHRNGLSFPRTVSGANELAHELANPASVHA